MSDDLRSSMEQIYDKLNEGDATDAPSVVAPPSAEAEPDAPQEKVESPEPEKAARGPDGKFRKEDVKADATKIEGEQPTESKDQPETARPPKGAPGSWSKAAQTKWDALPLEVKEAVLKRESEMGRLRSQSGERVKEYGEIDKALEPVTPLLNLHGMSKAQYIGNLVRAEQALQNPQTRAAAFQYLAQQYSFDLSQLQPVAQPQVNPEIMPLQQKISQLEQMLMTREEQARLAESQEIESEIQAFANDAKNEFFEDVKPLMARYLQTGAADNLQDAYDLACRKTPEIAAILEARRQDEIQKKLAQASRKTAAPAKRAAATNVRGTANSPGQVPDMRQGMEEVYNRLVNGA